MPLVVFPLGSFANALAFIIELARHLKVKRSFLVLQSCALAAYFKLCLLSLREFRARLGKCVVPGKNFELVALALFLYSFTPNLVGFFRKFTREIEFEVAFRLIQRGAFRAKVKFRLLEFSDPGRLCFLLAPCLSQLRFVSILGLLGLDRSDRRALLIES